MTVVDTEPLPESRLEPPGSEAISAGGYRLGAVATPGELPDLLVLVAMSGGGKRSAAFAYGALKGMREVAVPVPGAADRTLLHEVDGISGVSGGSFTAAYYGLYRDRTFDSYERDFLYSDTNAYIFGIYLLPWNWRWLTDPAVGTNDYMERVYDRTDGKRPADYRDRRHRCQLWGAVHFHPGVFDILCSDLSAFPVARGGSIERVSRVVFTGHTHQSRGFLRWPDAGMADADNRCGAA